MSEPGHPSTDPAARIAELEALLAARDADLAAAQAELQARDLLIETLKVQIARLRSRQFGRSSEKLTRDIAQLELALEELETAQAIGEDRRPEQETRKAPVVRAWPAHLARDAVVIEPPSGACTCPACGGELRRLSADSDELLDIVPVSYRISRHVRPKYSCRLCERIVQAPAPVEAVARGRATFATLAGIVVAKFDHHLPLYRQAEMMAAQGLAIDRSTLAGWVGHAAALLDPIVSRIRATGLGATKLHADDTPVPVLDPGRGKTATGRLWVYAADDRASGSEAPPLVWSRFTPDRSAAHVANELKGFKGALQADAYAGYEPLYASGRVSEVACWGHFRRKVFDIHRTKETALTTAILEQIGELYRIEETIRGRPPDERRATRQQKTKPLVDTLKAMLEKALRQLSPRAEMAKAINYGLKRWTALGRFIDDGRLEIDNLIAERALRGVAIGRKNWLFAGSHVGGERAAALYTVIETAKMNGLEPQAYIADVIARIAGDWPASRWDELMPWNWQPAVATPVAAAA